MTAMASSKSLRDLRMERGYSQDDLASRMRPRTSAAYISQLETGHRSPGPGTIRRLSVALGCSTERVYRACLDREGGSG